MKKLDVRLLRMIKHSKGQFISVVVIVAVALLIYMLFNVTSINIRDSVNDYYALTNFNDIHIQLVRIPQGAAAELLTIDGIEEVQGRISLDVPLQVENKDEKVSIRLISIPEDKERINILYRLSGQRVKLGTDNVFLLEQFAKARNIKPGDTLSPKINGRVHELSVSGIVASPEFIYLMENEQAIMPAPEKFGVAFVSEEFAQSVSGHRGSYNELLIKVDDESKIDDIVDRLEKKLDKYGVKRIIEREDQLSHNVLMQKMDGTEKMATILPVMFLIVAAIIISIMLSRIVQNDRMAIGVLKALGHGNISILSHYTKYALSIGMIGSILGIAGGLYLSGPFSQLFGVYFNIPLIKIGIYYSFILSALVLTSIFCIISGFIGARSVLRIMPADSMRPEAPKTGKRILLERIGFIWRRVAFSWKMVIRNIMRNKRRFAFLVLGLALAYSINTVPLFEAEAFSAMFELQYGEYQRMDYTIEFSRPMNQRVIKDLSHLIDASIIEPELKYPFELKNGWRRKAINVIGVPKSTVLYEFKNGKDIKVTLPEKGFFVTEALAKTLNVKKGDRITIKNFVPGKEDVVVTVSDVVKQYLGANAYMDIEAMEELLVDKEMITGVSIASKDNVKEKLKDVKNISAVNSVTDMKNTFMEFMDTMMVSVSFYLIFGGVLGFAIIYNATIIGISERNMEFASLRVMGFDKKDIFKMVNRENLVMAGIAMLVGVPLGLGMINGLIESFSSEMFTFPRIITPKTFIYAAIATLFFVIIAQLAARKKIYRMNFIDALKSRIS